MKHQPITKLAGWKSSRAYMPSPFRINLEKTHASPRQFYLHNHKVKCPALFSNTTKTAICLRKGN